MAYERVLELRELPGGGVKRCHVGRLEASLSVAEADKMLKELAEAGQLEVRVRDGGLFYAPGETGEGVREIEDR